GLPLGHRPEREQAHVVREHRRSGGGALMSDAKLFPTPDQTVGPYYAIGMEYPEGEQIVPRGQAGSIVLSGYVYDGNGDPVPDAVVELWQADAAGNIPKESGGLVRK